MTRTRPKLPRLIERPYAISQATGHYPMADNPRPVCNHFGDKDKKPSATLKVTIDHGYKKKNKRGRPPKDPPPEYQRYEHIGWWCPVCNLFYYMDGTPEWRPSVAD